MTKVIKAIIVIAILAGIGIGFCFGLSYVDATLEPQIQMVEVTVEVEKVVEVEKEVTVEVEKVVEVEKEITVEVEKIVTQNVTVEKVVEVPVALRQFESLEELRSFLGEEGWYGVLGADGLLKCDANALLLQNQAMEAGYIMYFQAIYPNIYNPLFHRMQISYATNGGLHAINAVIIGKNFYYIEPQTREVVLGGYLN